MVAVHPVAVKSFENSHSYDSIEHGKFMNHFNKLNEPNEEIPGLKPEVFGKPHYTSGRTTKKLAAKTSKFHFQLRRLHCGM